MGSLPSFAAADETRQRPKRYSKVITSWPNQGGGVLSALPGCQPFREIIANGCIGVVELVDRAPA
jgi:hypothetical protein